MASYKIGILGAGKVGRALGSSWTRAGHQITYGVRQPKSEASQALEAAGAEVASISATVRSSDVILLAIPAGQIESTLSAAGHLNGKIIFDCSNPQSPAVHHQELPPYTLVEKLAGQYPKAHFVKIFNTVGFEVLGNPSFHGTAATMFFCCDDDAASGAASTLAEHAGFEPVRLGALKQARMLEDLTRFWGALAYGAHQGRGVALKMLHREEKS